MFLNGTLASAVSNTGDADLTDCIINDATLGIVDFSVGDLPAGEMSPEIPFVDADGVLVSTTNIADVSCQVGATGTSVTDDDTVTVTPIDQGVTLDKIVRGEPEKVYRMTGDDTVTSSINYDYTICSTPGSAALVCDLFDDVIGNGVDPNTSIPIQTGIVVGPDGACNTATANHVISDADVVAMEIVNNALVSCLGQQGLDPEIAIADVQVDVLEWNFSVTDVCTPESQVVSGPGVEHMV